MVLLEGCVTADGVVAMATALVDDVTTAVVMGNGDPLVGNPLLMVDELSQALETDVVVWRGSACTMTPLDVWPLLTI